jgi:predicted ATPase/class 3 adenylate cyclase
MGSPPKEAVMLARPTGTVTFLFSDIEGSTRLLQRLGDSYASVLAEHNRLLRAAFEQRSGHEIGNDGDAFFVAFASARDAVAAAVAAQRSVNAHHWPEGIALRVRMGVHTGEPLITEIGYVGIDVHVAARISAAGHGGQILLSEATRNLVEQDLPGGAMLRDLAAHRLKDLARPQRLFQVVVSDLPTDFPPLRTSHIFANNLTRPLTRFIGREREMAEAKRLLSTTRLLTLTGGGGSGKTRLAVELAAELLDHYQDGVWLVELAGLSDPALVPHSVAFLLGVPEQSSRSITETLVDYLRHKSTLLLIDNCEHLLSACAKLVDALLRNCARLRIVATSREGLGITGETLYPVSPLPVPDPQRGLSVEDLIRYEAVQLFVDRATAILPSFKVTPQNAHSVAQVCHRLDGIPLAIELAAVRVKVLAMDQIVVRLDDRFRLLIGGSRTALLRHQTLRAAMDWSYDLLPEKEQWLLRRLSVFAGGWTLDAAEDVCAGDGVEELEVFGLLTQLVDKSLVMMEIQGEEARYRLLETVRQYARDRLAEPEETDAVRRRHRDWYLRFAEQAEREIRRPEQVMWLERLHTEHDNLRAALEWSRADEDGAEAGIRLVGALVGFWLRHGHWSEARGWIEGALARRSRVPPSVLPKALHGATNLAWRRGDYNLAKTLGEEGLALCDEFGDKENRAWLLHDLGIVALRQADHKRATALFERSLSLGHELGDKGLIGTELALLGHVAIYERDYERAKTLHTDSLAVFKEVGDKWHIPLALRSLGTVALYQGDYVRAAAAFAESLMLGVEVRHRWVSEECLEGLAAVASATGLHERAARLFGAAEVLRETLGYRLSPPDQISHDERVTRTCTALGNAALAGAWAEGRAMSLEQAIEHALELETK